MYDFPNILKERVSGTPTHATVKEVRTVTIGREREEGGGREKERSISIYSLHVYVSS